MSEVSEGRFKVIMIYLNESQKGRLEDFFEDIGFYYYSVQSRTERVINQNLRHKNSKIWPGTDCFFHLAVSEDYLDEMLSYLKTFRMSLSEGIVMSVAVIPLDHLYPNLYEVDLPVKEEMLDDLKKRHNFK